MFFLFIYVFINSDRFFLIEGVRFCDRDNVEIISESIKNVSVESCEKSVEIDLLTLCDTKSIGKTILLFPMCQINCILHISLGWKVSDGVHLIKFSISNDCSFEMQEAKLLKLKYEATQSYLSFTVFDVQG